MKRSCGVAWLCLALCGLSPVYADVTPREVEGSLKTVGEQATLERFFSCERYEGTAYPEIASGKPEWVALAVKILGEADACYAEGILSALGQAMQHRPKAVLPYVNSSPRLTADRICLPFISDELPIEEQLRQVRAVKKSLLKVTAPRLATQTKACLGLIGQLEGELQLKQGHKVDR